MPKCGEKPGKGFYRSVQTGEIIRLDTDDKKLPPCPIDKKSCDWEKVE